MTFNKINASKTRPGVNYTTNIFINVNCTCPGFQNCRDTPQHCTHTDALLLDTGEALCDLKRKQGKEKKR